MTSDSPKPNVFDALPAPALLVASRALQALATPLTALLIGTAAGLGAEAENAISFCNVLFVGNLCASAVVAGLFGPRRIAADLRALDGRQRFELFLLASGAALLSSLIFTALATTTVTNAVLLARVGPVLFALASAWLLRQPLRAAEWTGFGLIGCGILATVFVASGFTVVKGDLLILVSAAVYAAVTLLSKRLLPATGLGSLVFARNFFSALVFFAIAISLYGPGHFADAFYGPLWGIMGVYAAIVVVAAQLAWYRSIAVLPATAIARWTVLTPLLAAGYAFALNGERPGASQLVALGFVTVGILVSNLGHFTPKGAPDSPESSVAAA